MPELRPAVPAQRAKRMKTTLKTCDATDEAVRSLSRAMAVQLDRSVTHDEVISAAVKISGLHLSLLAQYMQERAPR